MSAAMLSLAASLVRAWTRVYTWQLPADLAAARRAEIASDLWEQLHDGSAGGPPARALQMIARLLAGIPDDVLWRVGEVEIFDSVAGRRMVAVAAAVVIVVSLVAMPALLAGSPPTGRARVEGCVIALPVPETTTDLRLTIITCAGAFFSPAAGGR
jgi:hypothetical protein